MNLTTHQLRAFGKSVRGNGKVKLRRTYYDKACKSPRAGYVAVETAGKRIVIDYYGHIIPPKDQDKFFYFGGDNGREAD